MEEQKFLAYPFVGVIQFCFFFQYMPCIDRILPIFLLVRGDIDNLSQFKSPSAPSLGQLRGSFSIDQPKKYVFLTLP